MTCPALHGPTCHGCPTPCPATFRAPADPGCGGCYLITGNVGHCTGHCTPTTTGAPR